MLCLLEILAYFACLLPCNSIFHATRDFSLIPWLVAI